MAAGSLEERVTALEAELSQLRRKIEGERPGVIGRTLPDFLQNYVGRSANSPMFDEVTQAIEEERDREREAAQHIVDAEEAGK